MPDPPRDIDASARPIEAETPAGAGRAPGDRFAFLDALRGLGALGITCYHVHRYRPLEIPADHIIPNTIQFIVRHGWASVQVFWVIAGFVLAYSLRKTAVGPVSFGNFTLRRVLRLGIPYWTAILAVAAVDTFTKPYLYRPELPLVDDPITWSRLAANLGFLQDVLHRGNITAGTWFVCVDLQFGLLFALILWIVQRLSPGQSNSSGSGKTNSAVLLLAFIPLGLASLFVLNFKSEALDSWAIYYFHMPLLGAMAWWALEGRIPRFAFWAYAAVMAVGVAMRWYDVFSIWQLATSEVPGTPLKYGKALELTVALTAGVVIYLVGRLGHLGDWLTWRPLQYLGRVSYSLYLTHYLTSWIIVSLGCYWTRNNAWAAVGWMVGSVFISIGVAGLVYRYVESPSLRLVKRLRS
jgi:peptidoglycan/LPS O-acetylase OafA/YrhL